MKARIGLTTGFDGVEGKEGISLPAVYADAVLAGGGIPLLLPPPRDEKAAKDLLDACDGLLATGGKDLDPALWGEAGHPKIEPMHPRKQRADLLLIAGAYKRRMPVLGICLGCQEMAVSRGGSLVQHVPDEPGATIEHRKPKAMRSLQHRVAIEPGSLLAQVVGAKALNVNTSHHQAVRKPGRRMRIVAHSPDGIVEGIEATGPGRFFLGIQWHPEHLCGHPRHLALFQALSGAAAAGRSHPRRSYHEIHG